jgi:hypothetical protein
MKKRVFLRDMDEIGRTALDSICYVGCKNPPSSLLFQSEVSCPAPVISDPMREGIH